LFVLQESGNFTWKVSDCEELVETVSRSEGRSWTKVIFLDQWQI